MRYKANRHVLDRFSEESARHNVEADLELIGHYDTLLQRLELEVLRKAKAHDPQARFLLRTIPGVGEILSHVLLYEIHTVDRFASVGHFLSYARLVTPQHTSDGVIDRVITSHSRSSCTGR